MKTGHLIIALALLLTCSGSAWCLSPQDVLNAKQSGDEGITVVYPVNQDQAWEIAHAVLHWLHSNMIEDHQDQNYMLTSIGASTCACRAEVGVWIETVRENYTRVTIITKGKVSQNDFTKMETFHDKLKPDFIIKFRKGVEIVKIGRQLPFNPP